MDFTSAPSTDIIAAASNDHALPKIVLDAFQDLPREPLLRFLKLGVKRPFFSGDVIIQAGDVPEGLVFLLIGSLAVEREGYILREFQAGAAIGEGSLVRDQAPSVSIRATSDGVIFVIPRNAAREFFAQDAVFGVALLSHLMRDLFERLEMTNQISAENHDLAKALEANNRELKSTLERLSEINQQLNEEVTTRKRIENENRSLARLASDSPSPIMRASKDGFLLYANMPSLRLISHWRITVNGYVHEELRREVIETFEGRETRHIEMPVGDRRYIFTLAPIIDAEHVNIYGRDVTDERLAVEHLSHLANHDVLTGLPNRKQFLDRLTEAMHSDSPSGAVFFLDLDHFKEINDSLGHLVGDQLLQIVARRLIGTVRKTDLVTRLGGDEFAILMLGGLTEKPAAEHAKRFIETLSRPYQVDSSMLHIGVSIGIAFLADGPPILEEAVRNADLAMYKAKSEGRNTYRFFKPEYDIELRRRLELESDIRVAMQDNQFHLHFQPKIELATRQIIGSEALLRWTHPVHGVVGPNEFIPAAERSGLIQQLGDWVIRQAFEQLMDWRQRGLPLLPIAVNLSPVQLKDPNFVKSVISHWLDTKLSPSMIEFEITEGVIMADVEHGMEVMRQLSEVGFTLSIDDFGTGYSSLSYLRRFPVDKVKIDRSFVMEMTEDKDAAAIANSIIGLGRSLNLRIVAEGIETQAQLDHLLDQGCDEGQGYMFSRPLPPDAFDAFLRDKTTRTAEGYFI